ncbi:MAG: transcriptional regulator [Fervidicoccaceae archaeon]|jgi:predicted DNA-binding transcriptional regulator|uniref:Transcriptional regulator n=1 Tax=Fervidicoccus fontis TaxID=683846 RepID=A0A7C2UKT2_9CREN|nr:MAG: transcriptional regulator [Fervidicoccus sp.]HEU97490.1 transcriptional regulator [Fervidicoccus fontis]
MARDKAIGGLLLIASLVIIVLYAYFVFFTSYDLILLKLTGFIAVAGVFGILSWIGYTLATTPPPKPIEEIEKEIESELKKLDEESKTSTQESSDKSQ